MKFFRILAILLMSACGVAACVPERTQVAPVKPPSQIGIASWYGPGLHGERTANGEVFDQNTMSAAHRTFPMPSLVEVKNIENGLKVVVRVNDRGPFAEGRIIDVSRAAAAALDFQKVGHARVELRYLGPAPAVVEAKR